MAFWSGLFGGRAQRAAPAAAVQGAGGGRTITTAAELEQYLASGGTTSSGVDVSVDAALGISAVYACVRLKTGVVGNLPLDIKRRVSDSVRVDAAETDVARILRRKPNRWQTPSEFKRMMQAHVELRGAGTALKVTSMGKLLEVIPMHPDRVKARQRDDLSIVYTYTRRDGRQIELEQHDVFRLMKLSLDGVQGVTPLTYARETIGLSLAMERHGGSIFRNGARVSSVLKHPGKLGIEGLEFVRRSLDQYRAGGEAEGKSLILEEGMDVAPMAMTSEDAQWIDSRKFTRGDIAMFFGVPPSMIGDNTGADSNWGTGLEQKTQGFVTFSAEDDFTMWEEAIFRDLIANENSDLYARFNRAALVRGDIKARWEAYVKALQWGVYSPDEVRALEDMNPRPDGLGGKFYDPPNTAGNQEKQGAGDDPAGTA